MGPLKTRHGVLQEGELEFFIHGFKCIAFKHIFDKLWGDVIHGNFSGLSLISGGTSTALGVVRLFLATIFGAVSFLLAVEAGIAGLQFHFPSFSELWSSTGNVGSDGGINIHMVPSLGCGEALSSSSM